MHWHCQFIFKCCLKWFNMRSIVVLVLAYYVGVKCEDSSGFAYEILITEIDNLKLSHKNLRQELEHTKQQTTTLQAQVQSKNATIGQLKKQFSELTVATNKNVKDHKTQSEKFVNEIKELKISQKSLRQELEQAKQQTSTLQAQLQSKSVTLVQLQKQFSELAVANLKNVKDHLSQTGKFVNEIQELKTKQKTFDQRLEQSKQQTLTLQTQLQNKDVQLQQQMSQLTQENVKSEGKHQAQCNALDNLNQVVKQLRNNLQHLLGVTSVLLETDYKWVTYAASSRSIPTGAAFVGYDHNAARLYVARARYEGDYFVAKASSAHSKCYITHGDREVELDWCEVLVVPSSRYSWASYSGDTFPDNALSCGKKANGASQYIGRALHEYPSNIFRQTPGTIDNILKSLSVPFGGTAHTYYKFDVLVLN